MRILIAEDELFAYRHLVKLLNEVGLQYHDVIYVKSIAEFSEWFAKGEPCDLMFLDIHLQDGNSLQLFEAHKITCPVIFITAYDQYIIDSYKAYSLSYLLKPITREQLEAALAKYYEVLEFYRNPAGGDALARPKKERILVQKGSARTSVAFAEVAFFYSDSGLTFAVDFRGDRYFLDYSLNQVESLVDPRHFFRVKRQLIVQVSAIKEFRSIEFSKMELWLQPTKWLQQPLTISQTTAPAFKEWISSL
jgi:two-component system, LytTR family, response regulator LytT